jgi:hypothetical protein
MKITMPDGRAGIVESPPFGTTLYYRVQWDDGSEGVITPEDFEGAEKSDHDDEPATQRPRPVGHPARALVARSEQDAGRLRLAHVTVVEALQRIAKDVGDLPLDRFAEIEAALGTAIRALFAVVRR